MALRLSIGLVLLILGGWFIRSSKENGRDLGWVGDQRARVGLLLVVLGVAALFAAWLGPLP